MGTHEQIQTDLSDRYLRFAKDEARDHSPLYATLACHVANDHDTLSFLMTLPRAKRQPNLLLAAVRHLFGVSPDWHYFRRTLLANADAVRSVMLARSTQTNEPARCAVLLPVLAQLPQPLALIKIGASAGLCLLPDLYGYDYGPWTIHPEPAEADHPVFACSASGATPLPTSMPHIAWRAGLDVNPLDPTNPSQVSWLETLVWPEQTGRLANLRAALRIAAAHQPRVVTGNLLDDSLAALCCEAPPDATLVVFHTAVLAYVAEQSDRQAFADKVTSLCPYWLSNESSRIFPDIKSRAGAPSATGRFLLSLNGTPLAWTDPHGAAIEWIAHKGRKSIIPGPNI